MPPNPDLIYIPSANPKNFRLGQSVSICYTPGSLPERAAGFRKKIIQNDINPFVKDAAEELKGKVGVIVLAQASMGHLAEAIEGISGVSVLKSPLLAMDALVARGKE